MCCWSLSRLHAHEACRVNFMTVIYVLLVCYSAAFAVSILVKSRDAGKTLARPDLGHSTAPSGQVMRHACFRGRAVSSVVRTAGGCADGPAAGRRAYGCRAARARDDDAVVQDHALPARTQPA